MAATSESDHRLAIRTPYSPNLYGAEFSERETALLRKYGSWLEALSEKWLSPISDGQRAFVAVCDGLLAPISEFELLWHKYHVHRMTQHAGSGDYFVRAYYYGIAAQLGSAKAREWLEAERSHLESERYMPDITPRLLPLRMPTLAPRGEQPVLGNGGSARAGIPHDRMEDWGNSGDDRDGADWERYIGGPDDSD